MAVAPNYFAQGQEMGTKGAMHAQDLNNRAVLAARDNYVNLMNRTMAAAAQAKDPDMGNRIWERGQSTANQFLSPGRAAMGPNGEVRFQSHWFAPYQKDPILIEKSRMARDQSNINRIMEENPTTLTDRMSAWKSLNQMENNMLSQWMLEKQQAAAQWGAAMMGLPNLPQPQQSSSQAANQYQQAQQKINQQYQKDMTQYQDARDTYYNAGLFAGLDPRGERDWRMAELADRLAFIPVREQSLEELYQEEEGLPPAQVQSWKDALAREQAAMREEEQRIKDLQELLMMHIMKRDPITYGILNQDYLETRGID